jgi:diguanylate cyclase (GGDEF)-like protein
MTAPRRNTIGVLIGFQVYEGSRPNPFLSPVLHGIQAAARDQGINLMVSCGVSRGLSTERLYFPAWPESFGIADFMPVGPWNTDGLLVINPLRFPEQIRYIQDLEEKRFPVFFIGTGAGTPAIMVDNEAGIQQAVEHLVKHGHREIAFIAGDETDPGDSQLRLKAYREAVRLLSLKDDPHLVEFGRHWEGGGYDAMNRLLKAGVKFSAVVCSNDESAVGVLRAIQESGLRVPWDVAVTGFDDHLTALAQVPPLTSVHYPLFETGYRALLMIRKWVEQGAEGVPEVTRVSTWLVPRQSCGCLPEAINAAVVSDTVGGPAESQHYKEDLARTMMESLLAETTPADLHDIRPLCDRLVESFFLSLQDGDLSHFQIALIEILQRIETLDDDVHAWQAVVSILRAGAHTLLADEVDPRREEEAEDLLHQARTLISESARRRYMRMQLQQTQNEEAMGRLTARLLFSLDEEQIYSTLQDHLPRVGIRSGYVVFFEPQAGDPTGGSRLKTYQPDAPPLRFASRHFPPPGLYPEGEPFSLALLPLVFQNEKMGYVAFDGGNLIPLATVVRQLASAVKSAELHAKVLELSLTDGLTGVYNRRYFELLLQKEVERSQRYNRRLATIIIDIDHFKRYNDSFGHPAGDEALRRVAEDIQNSARRGLDVVTRYGGEEFAIILPETDTDGAWIVAENIRKHVDGDNRFLRKISVSLGIASLSGDQLTHDTLVDHADRALYQAKNQGRDRTVIFEDWMQESAHAKTPGG